MPSEKNCCVPNCNVKRGDQITLHSFPNPDKEPDRFRSWIYAVKGDILALDNKVIYEKRRICHNHFETKYRTWTKTLTPNAIPTLHLPGTLQKRQPLANIINEPASSSSVRAADANIPPTQPVPNIEAIPMHQSMVINEVEPKQSTVSTTKKNTKKPVTTDKTLMTEIKKLKKRNMSYQKRLKQAQKLSSNTTFQKALSKFRTLAAIFTVMQFREITKPKMGRRFTKEEKIMSLSLYKNGPKAYRWLSKIFVLPSPVTLSRVVSRANLRPGINENIFKQLQKSVNKMKNDERLRTLIFDEMALSPHFEYNKKKR